jgi:hypothetical protein
LEIPSEFIIFPDAELLVTPRSSDILIPDNTRMKKNTENNNSDLE